MTLKRLTFLSLALSIAPLFAQAQEYARVVKVKPRFDNIVTRTPSKQCSIKQVPIYGTQEQAADAGDVIGGMVIGGLIGGTVTGKDNGAAVGAVIGGLIANEEGKKTKRVIVGYKDKEKCKNIMVKSKEKVLKNYKITYKWKGIVGTSFTNNHYRKGDMIPISVSINAM
jgi:uncharacterized protein YcfJ